MANPVSGTYSFLDVVAAWTDLAGGGSFTLEGSGLSAEGITVVGAEDKSTMVIGCGGDGMHSLKATKAARVTLRLLKTGRGNALLGSLYNYQSASSALWGQNQLTVTNPVTGDKVTCTDGAFVKEADVAYAVEGGIMEWQFNFVACDKVLGNGYNPTGLLLAAA